MYIHTHYIMNPSQYTRQVDNFLRKDGCCDRTWVINIVLLSLLSYCRSMWGPDSCFFSLGKRKEASTLYSIYVCMYWDQIRWIGHGWSCNQMDLHSEPILEELPPFGRDRWLSVKTLSSWSLFPTISNLLRPEMPPEGVLGMRLVHTPWHRLCFSAHLLCEGVALAWHVLVLLNHCIKLHFLQHLVSIALVAI